MPISNRLWRLCAVLFFLSMALTITAAVIPVDETSISVRSPGEVGEHFDPEALVKRINWRSWRLLGKVIAVTYVTKIICQSPAAAVQPANIVCAAAAVFSIAMIVSGRFRNLIGRDDAEVEWADAHLHHFPARDGGPSPVRQLQAAYNGTAVEAATCIDPTQPNCFDVLYQNHMHSDNVTLLHHFSVQPGKALSAAQKRQCDGCDTGAEAVASDGTDVFVDYIYKDQNDNDEVQIGYDGDFPANWAQAVENDSVYAGVNGEVCSSMVYNCDEVVVGYLTINNNHHEADPDDIPNFIDTCQTAYNDAMSQGCIAA